MAIEIVDFPIKNGDFPLLCDSSPEGNWEGHPKTPRLIQRILLATAGHFRSSAATSTFLGQVQRGDRGNEMSLW